MILEAEKMVFGGDCIGKINGKTVFVPYAIPGEKLEVEIISEERDYSKAKIVNVVEPSPHRVEPFCPLYTQCGGCNMQHISSEYQKELRMQILRDAFEREGVSAGEIKAISGNDTGYRSRFQFHNGGLMGRRSNEIVRLQKCPCATDEINHYLKEVPENERPLGRVHVFGSSNITSIPEGFDKLVIAEQPDESKNKNWKKQPPKQQQRTPSGAKLKKQKKIKARYEGTNTEDQLPCTISLCGKNITFDVKGFFQSNMGVLEKAIPIVTGGLEGKNVLDMYSGCGTFSVFLKDSFENITLVEHNKGALVYAEQNLAGTKHESFGVSGEVWVKYHAQNCIDRNGSFDAVVIDPPRSGMEKAVCQWLQSSNIPEIRSVSCDIATHARDIKFLLRAGYILKELYLLDFYPQTGHIESLAILQHE